MFDLPIITMHQYIHFGWKCRCHECGAMLPVIGIDENNILRCEKCGKLHGVYEKGMPFSRLPEKVPTHKTVSFVRPDGRVVRRRVRIDIESEKQLNLFGGAK